MEEYFYWIVHFSYVRNIRKNIYNIFVNKANWKRLLFYIRIFY